MASHVNGAGARDQAAAVVKVSMWIAVPVALGLTGLSLVSSAQYAESMVCQFQLDAPCPGTWKLLTVAGAVALATGVVLAWRSIRNLRRPGQVRHLAPGLSLLFAMLALAAVVSGPSWGNAAVELGALASATGVLSLRVERPRLLHVALVAQAADLATFGAVWQLGRGEANPLGGHVVNALAGLGFGQGDDGWTAAVMAGFALIAAKVLLIGFLVHVTPYLGRYAHVVLATAAVVGAVGAIVNASVL